MELHQLSEILKNTNFKFIKNDYLYHHQVVGYPLIKDMNFEHFYFVTEVLEQKLKAKPFISTKDEEEMEDAEFNFNNWDDKWWFIRMPKLFFAQEL